MRQTDLWHCEIHPANQKKIVSTGPYRIPVCDWQTEDAHGWPCKRSMIRQPQPELGGVDTVESE
jgi:hypothetical protein